MFLAVVMLLFEVGLGLDRGDALLLPIIPIVAHDGTPHSHSREETIFGFTPFHKCTTRQIKMCNLIEGFDRLFLFFNSDQSRHARATRGRQVDNTATPHVRFIPIPHSNSLFPLPFLCFIHSVEDECADVPREGAAGRARKRGSCSRPSAAKIQMG